MSALTLLLKVLERLLHDQLSKYLQRYLNTLLCHFWNTHSTQHVLFKLLQAWKEELDQSGYVRTILMDLSKAYYCLPHDLLAGKFKHYSIGKNDLYLIHNYLSNRKQQTKTNFSCSEWYDIVRGVPQSST